MRGSAPPIARNAAIGRAKRIGLVVPARCEHRPPLVPEGTETAESCADKATKVLRGCGPAAALVHDVLVKGMTMEQIGQRRGLCTQRWKDYFSRRVQQCLDRLAPIYGFATKRR